jgi:malonyl-CoA/methylmalonyl-CoA synthetase
MSANLFSLFQSRFPTDKSRVFLETESGREITFAELEATVARYAGLIRALGVTPGERVAVQVEKSPEALMLYLACLAAGVVYLPLNSAYREGEIAYFLGDAEPKIFVHSPRDEAWVQPICEKLSIAHCYTMNEAGSGSWAENALNAAPIMEFVNRGADDLAAILYTSGTTGRSKGAMITHRNLSSNALTLHQYWGFQAGDILLHALPLFHVHGLFVAAHTALLNTHQGGRLIFHTKFDAKAAMVAFARATVFMGVPTMYTRLLAEPMFNQDACRHMRLFVSGSAPLLAETFNEFKSRTGHTILERYGMTETGMITSNPLTGARKGGTVGLPLPGVAVRVCDADSDSEITVLATGKIGHIQVKGDNVLPGYWRMPEKNLEEFTSDKFFKTGDMGFIDADGYVNIVGRSKDLVISGGYNVYPKEIELVIDDLPGVEESAVIGLPHRDFGEAVAVVVVLVANTKGSNSSTGAPFQAISEAEIIHACKLKLANFKVPKKVFLVSELPRNAMGKVQKNELRKQYLTSFD